MSYLLSFFTFILALVSIVLVLLVLMQKTKDGGMGAALGGGATESAFGHETGNVLTKATINFAVAFFVLSLFIYLGQLYVNKHQGDSDRTMPIVTSPAGPTRADATLPLALPGSASTPATPAAAPSASVSNSAAVPNLSLPTTTTPAAASSSAPISATATKSAATP
jgi:preprotein translocase subunit SecG